MLRCSPEILFTLLQTAREVIQKYQVRICPLTTVLISLVFLGGISLMLKQPILYCPGFHTHCGQHYAIITFNAAVIFITCSMYMVPYYNFYLGLFIRSHFFLLAATLLRALRISLMPSLRWLWVLNCHFLLLCSFSCS